MAFLRNKGTVFSLQSELSSWQIKQGLQSANAVELGSVIWSSIVVAEAREEFEKPEKGECTPLEAWSCY
jgi:hypothetical protein